ncbi:MAG: hypothetical protein J6Q74_00865 [Clostridia bacterium]|nr:hypothetical protein [Clostridia bacterium]
MEKKHLALVDKSKFDNALYNLTRYLGYLDISVFALFCTALFFGILAVLLGFLESDYIFLQSGILILVITTAAYFLLIKPILLIMYAICKILINKEKGQK